MKADSLALLCVVALALWILEEETQAVSKAVNSVRNGKRIGPARVLDARGVDTRKPKALADAAGVELEAYSLASMATSEHGQDGDVYLVAICWAVRNAAGYVAGQTKITDKLTRRPQSGTPSALSGFYGRQSTSPVAYADTSQEPYERTLRIAREVLAAPKSADPTNGATNFYSPKAQDALHKKDPTKWKRDAAGQDALFRSWGLAPVTVAGIDSRQLTLYRSA